MKKQKIHILEYLLHPYVISLLIAIGVVFLLPNYFSKYQLVEDFDKNFTTVNNKFFYEDIDGDGFSERVILFDNYKFGNNASYHIHKANGDVVDQFNLDTKFPKSKIAWFQDANFNGTKEIYILTKSNDSIFLNIQEHIDFKRPIEKKVFVDKITGYQGNYEFIFGRFRKIAGVKYDPSYVHFSVSANYGGNPRKIYRYNPKNNEILKSPHFTNSGGIANMVDLDNDGKKEILLTTYATANAIDTTYTKRSDYTAWLTILDDDLQFLFEPIGFEVLGGIDLVYPKEKNANYVLALLKSAEHSKLPSKLLKVSLDGEMLKELILPKGNYSYINHYQKDLFVCDDKENGTYYLINSNLEIVKTFEIEKQYTGYLYDINKDDQKEWFFYNTTKSIFTIYEKDFKNKVSINFPNNYKSFVNMGVRYPENGDSQVFLQFNNGILIYSYKENPYYYFKYLFYFGVYACITTLTFLITKGQKIREQKKRAIEKEIADLQLKTIKNKVDPHFVFNALNTISEMTLVDDKLEVDRFINRFANFMRNTLAHSDKISTTLKEEINYTEDFIKLQQIRFNYKFDYKITISKDIDKSFKIPKHCIFTYVENALKYGIPAQEKGMLRIHVDKKETNIHIAIRDNGPGLQKQKNKKKGTGNGLKIMNKIFSLYENRYKTKIEHTITEIKKEDAIQGVLVHLKIATSTKK